MNLVYAFKKINYYSEATVTFAKCIIKQELESKGGITSSDCIMFACLFLDSCNRLDREDKDALAQAYCSNAMLSDSLIPNKHQLMFEMIYYCDAVNDPDGLSSFCKRISLQNESQSDSRIYYQILIQTILRANTSVINLLDVNQLSIGLTELKSSFCHEIYYKAYQLLLRRYKMGDIDHPHLKQAILMLNTIYPLQGMAKYTIYEKIELTKAIIALNPTLQVEQVGGCIDSIIRNKFFSTSMLSNILELLEDSNLAIERYLTILMGYNPKKIISTKRLREQFLYLLYKTGPSASAEFKVKASKYLNLLRRLKISDDESLLICLAGIFYLDDVREDFKKIDTKLLKFNSASKLDLILLSDFLEIKLDSIECQDVNLQLKISIPEDWIAEEKNGLYSHSHITPTKQKVKILPGCSFSMRPNTLNGRGELLSKLLKRKNIKVELLHEFSIIENPEYLKTFV